MSNVFWKVWAMLFVLSIFWLGWCIRTSAPAQAQWDAQDVRIVGVSGTLPVDIKKVDGKGFAIAGASAVSLYSPALPVKVVN